MDKYEISFDDYAIFMFHPVTTEFDMISMQIRTIVDAVIESGRNYIVIYPNNDHGSDFILHEIQRFEHDDVKERFRIFPSVRFEYFLTFLKNAAFIIGNSSAGVRETCVYGIPAIDIGSRQNGRYAPEKLKNIQHVEVDKGEILGAINNIADYRHITDYYGDGQSTRRFMDILKGDLWGISLQKKFIDIDF